MRTYLASQPEPIRDFQEASHTSLKKWMATIDEELDLSRQPGAIDMMCDAAHSVLWSTSWTPSFDPLLVRLNLVYKLFFLAELPQELADHARARADAIHDLDDFSAVIMCFEFAVRERLRDNINVLDSATVTALHKTGMTTDTEDLDVVCGYAPWRTGATKKMYSELVRRGMAKSPFATLLTVVMRESQRSHQLIHWAWFKWMGATVAPISSIERASSWVELVESGESDEFRNWVRNVRGEGDGHGDE